MKRRKASLAAQAPFGAKAQKMSWAPSELGYFLLDLGKIYFLKWPICNNANASILSFDRF